MKGIRIIHVRRPRVIKPLLKQVQVRIAAAAISPYNAAPTGVSMPA